MELSSLSVREECAGVVTHETIWGVTSGIIIIVDDGIVRGGGDAWNQIGGTNGNIIIVGEGIARGGGDTYNLHLMRK